MAEKWTRKKVRLAPPAWTFAASGARLRRDRQGYWLATRRGRGLTLRRKDSSHVLRLSPRDIRSINNDGVVALNCQVIVAGNAVWTEPLPLGYWEEPQ